MQGTAFMLVKEIVSKLAASGIPTTPRPGAASPSTAIVAEYVKIAIEPWIREVVQGMIDQHLNGSYLIKAKQVTRGSPLVTRLLAFLSGTTNHLLGEGFALLDWTLHVVHESAEMIESGSGLLAVRSFVADNLSKCVFDAIGRLGSGAAQLAIVTRSFFLCVFAEDSSVACKGAGESRSDNTLPEFLTVDVQLLRDQYNIAIPAKVANVKSKSVDAFVRAEEQCIQSLLVGISPLMDCFCVPTSEQSSGHARAFVLNPGTTCSLLVLWLI